jgi:hypothetical protein
LLNPFGNYGREGHVKKEEGKIIEIIDNIGASAYF